MSSFHLILVVIGARLIKIEIDCKTKELRNTNMIKIDSQLINTTIEKANNAERKRTNYNFHKVLSDTLQRMLNVMNKGTYVRPHKHEDPDKREAFLILKGKGVVIEFDNEGNVTDSILLDADTENYGCEIAPKVWHTIIPLEDGTVFYEVKDGPYDPIDDKNFASWAPAEGDKGCEEYNLALIKTLVA